MRFTLFSILILAFTGCSTMTSRPPVQNKEAKVSKSEKTTLPSSREMVERKLETMIKQALVADEATQSYLASDLFIKANDASLRGDAHTAAIIFKYIIQLNDKDLFLRKKYAIELIKVNELEGAKEQLTYLSKHGDKELVYKSRLLLAGVLSALGNNVDSEKLYKKLIYKSPKSFEISEACVFLSKSYVRSSKYKKAFKLLNYCNKRSKEKAMIYFQMAKIEFERERNKSAKKYLGKALKVKSNHYQSALLMGHILEKDGHKSKAAKVYKKFLKKNPNSYSILSRYVNLLFIDGKYREVIPYIEKLLAVDNSNLNLMVRLGVLYTEVGRVEDAKGVFKELLRSVPDSDKVLYYLASLYQQTGDNEEAINFFSRINDTSALFHESHVQIAQILNTQALTSRFQGKMNDQDRLFKFVRDNSKKSESLKVELNFILASYYESNKEYKQAINTLEGIRENESFTDGHIYYLAALYEKVKDYSNAEVIVRDILKKNPNNADALNFMGYSLLERGGDLDLAGEYIRKAVKLKPNDGYIRDSLGWYYYKRGQFKKAYREVKKAHSLVKSDVVITKHLALIYKAMKEYDKAKRFYVEALKNCKVLSEREDVLKELEALESLRLPASR